MNAVVRPQTFATAAATALRETLAASHGPLRDAVAAYRSAIAGLTPDADLLDVLLPPAPSPSPPKRSPQRANRRKQRHAQHWRRR